jgi:hypothetical protein
MELKTKTIRIINNQKRNVFNIKIPPANPVFILNKAGKYIYKFYFLKEFPA